MAALTIADVTIAASAAEVQPRQSEVPLNNADVVRLIKAGMGDTIVITAIRAAKATAFTTTPDALVRLKADGVSDAVIAVMLNPSSGASLGATAAEAGRATSANPNDPVAAREPGIYYFDPDGAERFVRLEPAVYSQAKSGGFLRSALTYGIAKTKSKAVVRGAHANLQIGERRPKFYFHFEFTNGGLGGPGWGNFSAATSANEFILARSRVNGKTNSRELVVGQFNAFGAQGGVMDEAVVPFDFKKIAPGVYEVVPQRDLDDGEYSFFYAGTAPVATYGLVGAVGGGKLFDFGIRVSPR